MNENIDRHVLAGFCCVDAVTQSSILSPLVVTGEQLRLVRNLSGVFAVMDVPSMDRSKTQSLLPSPASWPPPAKYEITVQDASLQYLPRRASIQAPQPLSAPVALGTVPSPPPTTTNTPTTTTTTLPGSTTTTPTTPAPTTTPKIALPAQLPPLTTPQTVTLYPSPAAPVAPNWAVVRALVLSNATPAKPLAGAVVQAASASGNADFRAIGVTNSSGEALLAVPGLAPTLNSTGSGAVTGNIAPATVSAWFDKALSDKPPDWISDPDDTLSALSGSGPGTTLGNAPPQTVQLARAQTVFVILTISL